MDHQNFSDELLEIRHRFLRSLPERVRLLETAMSDLTWSTSPKPEENFETLYSLTHQLVGTAGSVGFPALSETAKSLNLVLREIRTMNHQLITDDNLAEINSNFSALSEEAKRCLSLSE
ncbi:MAG: Hpt domain-containing protein [Acidiferrobacterales bacterium]|nr:Hpt domain-containing protein [Acidiferrobacterales bacterium]